MMIHQMGYKLRAQIHRFSGKLCTRMGKVTQRFVEEMLYGIQARGSVRLSEVARSLEERISLKKVIERLSRNLARRGLAQGIAKAVLKEGAMKVKEDTLLILDLTDITKKYATKMEYLAQVRDGSDKVLGMGYWVNTVVGAEVGSSEITPLVHKLYSQNAKEFVSENQEMIDAVRTVSEATDGRGIFVFDRGGDRKELYKELLGDPLRRFIVRQRGDRHLLYRGKPCEALTLAQSCTTPYGETVIKEEDGKEKPYFLHFGFRPVRLPGHPKRNLWLVVVKGFGQQPLMLLTTEPMRRCRNTLWWIVSAYMTRWRIEETIRFIKQSYDLEDVRVLTYQRLQAISSLVLAASFFAAVYVGTRAKLEILAFHVLKAAKRIFGIPDFRYYALADGIKEVLSKAGKGILGTNAMPSPNLSQFPLFST
jgi:hypothetical protein